MTRILKTTAIAVAICMMGYACNSGDKGKEGNTADSTATKPATATNEEMPGLAMIAGDNCLTCHKIDEKVNGPSYRDVANKYEATPAIIDTLALKIIHGGSGHWGTAIMVPHPQLSMDSAREMVKYILSLRNTK